MTMLRRRATPEDRLRPDAIEAVRDKIGQKFYAVLAPWAAGNCYDAIAVSLGMPIGTVKSRIHRGRALVVAATAALDHQQETPLCG